MPNLDLLCVRCSRAEAASILLAEALHAENLRKRDFFSLREGADAAYAAALQAELGLRASTALFVTELGHAVCRHTSTLVVHAVQA
jgi:hypothetical protein